MTSSTQDCTLHFFHAPAANTPQAARAHIGSAPVSVDVSLPGRYTQLLDALAQVYPDLRTSSDPSHREANLWPRGLPEAIPHPGHVLSLAFNEKFSERGVFAVAAACARRAGLLMLDARNDVLYLPDGSLVRADGSTARCRGVTRFAADLMRHPTVGMDEPTLPALRTLLAAGLQAMLDFHGFRRVDTVERVLFTRECGELRQTVVLQFERKAGDWIVSTFMWLQAPALAEQWLTDLGPKASAWYARHRAQQEGLGPDLVLGLYALHPEVPWSYSPFGFSKALLRQRDVPPYLGGWCDWLNHTGATDMDRLCDLTSLAHCALSDDAMRELDVARHTPAHQASLLVLAHQHAPEKFEQVCHELRRNLANERDGWPELDDPRLHHLERLIMNLRKPFG